MSATFKTLLLLSAAALLAGVPVYSQDVNAQETRLVGNQTASADSSLSEPSHVYGLITLPVSAAEPTGLLMGGTVLGQDIAARYSTSLYGGELGVFARVADRPVLLSTDSTTAFNLGASVGYGGFYFQGAYTGLNDNGALRSLQSWESWQAGLGFGGGAFDVRLTYAMGQATPAFAGRSFDNSQWMLGGIYQITPGIRFNADAFTGSRLVSPGVASAAPGASAPQGTGARVGVQLRF